MRPRCPLPEGAIGVCKVRFNEDGRLRVPWGYVGGVQCDPIEKKPFFHAYPGALAYSFGMLGCDLHCGYCQNWVTSQALRDPAAVAPPLAASPERLVRDAVDLGARVIVSTYNEPLITSEWAVAVFKEATAAGLATGFVSNGNGTPQVLEYLRPWVDLYKVDLKSFDDRHYRELGGRLEPILDTIRGLHAMGFWVEIVTLLIPGFNDSRDELTRLTAFIAGVSPDIPWHVTAFHGDYKMTEPGNTTAGDAARRRAHRPRSRACATSTPATCPARSATSRTRAAPRAARRSSSRYGYHIRDYRITADGCCPACASPVPGRFDARFRGQIASRPFCPGIAIAAAPAPSVIIDGNALTTRWAVRSATCGCRSPTGATCAASTACRRTDYVWLPREDVLHFEEISALVDVFLALGVDRLRLTGGEPLLRRDLPTLVRMLAGKPGLNDLAMTTNGILLADQIDALAAAGLRRITVSLDTLHADRFKALTRFDELARVHEGMAAAQPRVRPLQDRHGRHQRRERRRAGRSDRVRKVR